MMYRLTEDAWPDAQETINQISGKANERCRMNAKPALWEQECSAPANR